MTRYTPTLQSPTTYGWFPRPCRTPACNWVLPSQDCPAISADLWVASSMDRSPKLTCKEYILVFVFFLFFCFLTCFICSTAMQMRWGLPPENSLGVPWESCSQWVLQLNRDCNIWVSIRIKKCMCRKLTYLGRHLNRKNPWLETTAKCCYH